MRNYIIALTTATVICIGVAATIPILCLCICLARFCYVAHKKKEPKKKCTELILPVQLCDNTPIDSVKKAKKSDKGILPIQNSSVYPEVIESDQLEQRNSINKVV